MMRVEVPCFSASVACAYEAGRKSWSLLQCRSTLHHLLVSPYFSQKKEKLGAREFHAVKGVNELSIPKPIDHLLVTTSAQPDWKLFLPIMAAGGTIYPLSVSNNDLSLPYMPLINQGLRIQGSLVAARQVHREMLDFAALHEINPIIQTFPLDKGSINKAFKTLEDG
jgi:D-arabinose 1-dehydrogenase-like Zn-dependent alcohol dehydrogenase